jgi:ribosomal protein S18 acetylase RimI-like enzyme
MSVRTATAADAPLLEQLFRESRGAELAALPNEAARTLFISTQLAARNAAYARSHPDAESLIIVDESRAMAHAELDGQEGIGRLLVAPTTHGLHIVDVAVLATEQSRGHGTTAIALLIERADAADQSVTLTVLAQNDAARRLYRRLGFVDETSERADGRGAPSLHVRMRRPRHSEPIHSRPGAGLFASANTLKG